ncbi:MAG: penicillin-binding transpeptidase domain-containing protein [Bradymonadia bacterium]
MKLRILTPGLLLVHVLALHGLGAWFKWGTPDEEVEAASGMTAAPEIHQSGSGPLAHPPETSPGIEMMASEATRAAVETLPGHLDLDSFVTEDGAMFGDLGNGWTAELTLDPVLQKLATRGLTRGRVPFGAVVLLDPRTGDVLAMADRALAGNPAVPPASPDGPSHVALRAAAPAASIFKMITASALLDSGMRPHKRVCFNSARRTPKAVHLEAPKAGGECSNMFDALANSENAFFARAAHTQFKDPRGLRDTAHRFGFNKVLPFEAKTDASVAQVPDNPLERARMAAGFWHARLTPLHGALLAATIAEGGLMPTPRLVARVRTPGGEALDSPTSDPLGRPLSPQHARSVAKMMKRTMTHGTGRKAFTEKLKIYKHLRGVQIAGKTGTLDERTEDRTTRYTWFVGYAPADNPQVAIAVLVGNGETWWQKAIHVARYVLDGYFKHYPNARPQSVATTPSRRG